MMNNPNKLRQLINQNKILVLPGVYDCLSAKIAEQVGFQAVFSSGFGISAVTLGKPDYGFITATEMLNSVSKIAQSLTIPLIADIDTGYGNQLNVIRTVQEIIKYDVAGVLLEDQEYPKKCGHFEEKRVISSEEHVEKIRAAVHARGNSELVIIGRTDALANLGLEEAIKRGKAYAKAGADVIFIEAPQSIEEMKTIAKELKEVSLLANMVEGGKTPILNAKELEEIGFNLVVYPLTSLFSSVKNIIESLTYLKENNTTNGYKSMITFNEFKSIIGVEEYKKLEKQFSRSKI